MDLGKKYDSENGGDGKNMSLTINIHPCRTLNKSLNFLLFLEKVLFSLQPLLFIRKSLITAITKDLVKFKTFLPEMIKYLFYRFFNILFKNVYCIVDHETSLVYFKFFPDLQIY